MSSNETMPTAVLFDIDGTLVDSNFLHVEAWGRAFFESGLFVAAWRIQRAIGADSSKLLDLLIGDESSAVKESAKKLNTDIYATFMHRLRAFPDARELVQELAAAGERVVLATSAPSEELESLLRTLDLDESIHAVTSAEDVDTAKPEPDIIHVALEKGGVTAAHAVMIGDSSWDMIAAKRAGVASIGLLSGGTGREDLLDAGARLVFDDVADLRTHLQGRTMAELL
jgi:HAD superfamily hydrolase (TIGR01549 family)